MNHHFHLKGHKCSYNKKKVKHTPAKLFKPMKPKNTLPSDNPLKLEEEKKLFVLTEKK